MSDLVNLGAEAKVKYLDGDFIIEVGTHVFCAVTGKPILMEMLRYWNADLQNLILMLLPRFRPSSKTTSRHANSSSSAQ